MPAKKIFILGTAIKITSILNIATATTAKVTIEDPSGNATIDEVNMTKDADNVYSYIYQSDEDGDNGLYMVRVEVTYGGYTSVIEDEFELVEQS